jgi:uncharacterized membrane protein
MSSKPIDLLITRRWNDDMDNTLMRTITLATALGSGLMGGVLFGFSSFVMPALNRLPASDAVRAMQAINVTAPRGLGLPLVGSALGSVVVGVYAVSRTTGSTRALLVAGAAAGVAAFLVTAAYHIPRNNALDQIDPASVAVGSAWSDFEPGWVAMNHVRATLSVASAALLVAGAVRAGG